MKINNENLKALKEMGIKVPSYHRESLKRECVHIGLGHFHRSHFLTYMDKLLDAKITDSGVSLVGYNTDAQNIVIKIHEKGKILYMVFMQKQRWDTMRTRNVCIDQ